MRKLVAGMTIAAVLLLVPLPASAGKPTRSTSSCTLPATDLCTDYVAGRNRWKSAPIVYYVNDAGAPAGFSLAVQAAFDAWELELKSEAVEAAHPGDRSAIDFQYGGPTQRAPFKRDGFNVVGLTTPSDCDHCAGTSNTTSRGAIIESDIGFDPGPGDAGDVWTTDLSCPATDCGGFDVQGAATHEIGHALGLFHVAEDVHMELTMTPHPRRDDTFMRTLGAGDVLGVRALYPKG